MRKIRFVGDVQNKIRIEALLVNSALEVNHDFNSFLVFSWNIL